MPGGVDQVQQVQAPIARRVLHAYGLRLDRDAPLPLELHGVEELGAVVAGIDGTGELEDAVGQGRLPVVDVGDDREVADAVLVHAKLMRGAGGLATIATPPAREPAANGRKRGMR